MKSESWTAKIVSLGSYSLPSQLVERLDNWETMKLDPQRPHFLRLPPHLMNRYYIHGDYIYIGGDAMNPQVSTKAKYKNNEINLRLRSHAIERTLNACYFRSETCVLASDLSITNPLVFSVNSEATLWLPSKPHPATVFSSYREALNQLMSSLPPRHLQTAL